jgi:hypothetical protein
MQLFNTQALAIALTIDHGKSDELDSGTNWKK